MRGLIMEDNGVEHVKLYEDLEFATNDLEPRQVRVEIKAAGVCGSDLSCCTGKYYMPTPLVPGHEAAGVVTQIGSAVTYTQVGDHVILSTFGNCGHCPVCESGNPGNCGELGGMVQPFVQGGRAVYNFANLGAFAQEAIVSENQAIPIPKEVPLTSASLIGCGVVTGAGAVFNRAKVGVGDSVAVVGCGGVGLSSIQAAALSGAAQVIAIDTVADKEELVKSMGATDFIHVDSKEFDLIAAVKEVSGGGVNHAFEVVGSTQLLADCISMTKAGGNILAVGVPDLTATVTYGFQALHQNKNLMGVRAGGGKPRHDFPMLANLYLKGKLKLDEMISTTAGLDGIQQAFADLKAGGKNRTVILPNG